MSRESKTRKLNRLARALKLIGALTDPTQTTTGKLFNLWERGMTSAFERIAGSDTYLNMAGRMMEQGFRVQAESVRSTEAMLRAMRLPTASEIHDVQVELRRLRDQNEALLLQLELVLLRLEALRSEGR